MFFQRIHKEVHCALNSQCNIIPVFDNFVMPDPESLPSTMKNICTYNGVKWIHDYQDACVDKIERFIRGDGSVTTGSNYSMMDRFLSGGSQSTSSVASYHRSNTYQRTISNDTCPTSSSDDQPMPNLSDKDWLEAPIFENKTQNPNLAKKRYAILSKYSRWDCFSIFSYAVARLRGSVLPRVGVSEGARRRGSALARERVDQGARWRGSILARERC